MLREWAPLNDLFNNIPTKFKKGLFYFDVKLTCVDVLPDFIALGTNLGIIYWFDRKRKQIKHFACENSNIPITCIKLLSTVDYMVACGTNNGNISIFQIPKSHPESLPENLKPKSKQIEKYNVTDLHKGPITALAWSKNGMKLFSGDKNGTIVLTEIDFYMHISKSVEILNEAYEVVQLSYAKRYLLISTVYRSVICQQADKWNLTQVGKKDRKVLGRFGGIIVQNSYQSSDIHLYCSRPGLRIWIADVHGNVETTLLFKDLLTKESCDVPILNPVPKNLQSVKSQDEPSFSLILTFCEDYLVTYNSETVYVLDPKKMSILSSVKQIRGVLDVAICNDEIFVLETERSLIRISCNPEPQLGDNYDSACNTYVPLSTSIRGLTGKLQLHSLTPVISTENCFSKNINIYTDETSVTYAEEATTSPLKINKNFDNIGKQDFTDDILFRSLRKKRKKSKMTSSVTSLSSNGSVEQEQSTSWINDILPDMRSPDSIIHDIESKEKILADILRLDEINIKTDDEVFEQKQEKLHSTNNEILKQPSIIEKNVEVFKPSIQNPIIIHNNGVFQSSIKTKSDGNMLKNLQSKTASNGSPPANIEITKKGVISSDESASNNSPRANIETTKKTALSLDSSSSAGCAALPFEWNISNVQAKVRKDSNLSDISLTDWEII